MTGQTNDQLKPDHLKPDQRKPVVWLAGFPSSGLLKTQIAVANLLYGRVTSIHDLDRKVRPMGPVPLMAPDPAARPTEVIFTHHLATAYLDFFYQTRGVIYVMRHPLDCGISSAGYLLPEKVNYHTADEAAIARARDELIDHYVTHGSHQTYLYWSYGTWSAHILSWRRYVALRRIPALFLTFESIRADPAATVNQISQFLKTDADQARIADALDNWSLKVSRGFEEDAIAKREPSRFYVPELDPAYRHGWRYHGSGGGDYGTKHLSPEQWQRARATFGPVADTVGYSL